MSTRLDDLELLFKALADATRLRILALLADGEVCVCHIHESLRLPQPTVSRHLAYLRRAKLVAARREGVWMHYRTASIDDPVRRAALDAAVHAVGHVSTTMTDARRLERHQGVAAQPGRLLKLASSASCCCAPVQGPPLPHATRSGRA
jgi:ArsR family transcriptional regulator